MAKELTINLSLSFSKSGVSASMASGTQQFDVSGTDYERSTMVVPTSTTAIPLGNIATPGYFIVVNRDTTNYVDIYPSTGGAATIRLKPGEWAAFRFAAAAPAAKANAASVRIEYVLIAN